MDTAGKAVLFSGITVLISLTAVMLVPTPGVPVDGARDHALGRLHPRRHADAAARRAGQARPAGRQRCRCRGCTPASTARRASRAWGERLWQRPLAYGVVAVVVARRARRSRCSGSRPACRRSRSSRPATARASATTQVQQAFGPGAPGALQIVAPAGATPRAWPRSPRPTRASRRSCRRSPGAGGDAAGPGRSRRRPVRPGGRRHDRPAALDAPRRRAGRRRGRREPRPRAALSAQDAARDRRRARARLPAAARRAAGADHRRRRRAHQPARHRRRVRRRAADLPGRAPQSACSASSRRASSTPGAPVFFFAMIFAISMDYTVFLLSSAQGALGPQPTTRTEAMVGGVAHSGRVIFAAAAVMVAVFFTFALSGPLPPKEMGVILGVAVLLDAALVRLLLVPGAAAAARQVGLVAAEAARPRPSRRPLRARLERYASSSIETRHAMSRPPADRGELVARRRPRARRAASGARRACRRHPRLASCAPSPVRLQRRARQRRRGRGDGRGGRPRTPSTSRAA